MQTCDMEQIQHAYPRRIVNTVQGHKAYVSEVQYSNGVKMCNDSNDSGSAFCAARWALTSAAAGGKPEARLIGT